MFYLRINLCLFLNFILLIYLCFTEILQLKRYELMRMSKAHKHANIIGKINQNR